MKVDISGALGAVVREVRSGERAGKPMRVVVASRIYDTTPDDVWDALTSVERIPRWFLPISGDLRIGGRYQLKGNAGGEILRCDPPSRLEVTWEFGGQISWVEVKLTADGSDRTRLELEHTLPEDDHWKKFGPGAVGIGWDLTLLGLARHLPSGDAVDPDEAMAWLTSPDGKDFSKTSGDDWCRASIAAGADPAEARTLAAATLAAYTGEA
jgi:uncharacterized protein YndB with AHSA1/START domain